jgi:hypothetical protein
VSSLHDLPAWIPIFLALVIFLSWAYLKVAYPEDHFVDLYNESQAVTLATFRIVLDIPPNDPADSRVNWAARVLRNQIDQLLHGQTLWLHTPRARLLAVRKGSLVFEYDIYILVTGSAIAVLKNYSSLKQGMKALLDDATTIQRMVRVAFRKLRPFKLQSTDLRFVTDEELEVSLRRFQSSRIVERVLVRELDSTKTRPK